MSKQKLIIAMDISSTGKGGGPYSSTMNIVNSSLKEKYDFRLFIYRTEMGRFISIKRIRDIVRQLKELKPDIVHFTGLQLAGFHIAVACRLVGIKKNIVVIRGSSTEALDIGLIKKFLIYILETVTLAITSTFYGVSQYSSMLLVTKYFKGKNSGYVYNLPVLNKKSHHNFTKEDLGFGNNDILVVSVARITKDKGYHTLVETIKDFKNAKEVKFLVIGEGNYLKTMRSELTQQELVGQVRFLGYRDDVGNILPACDIFVLPTLHETLSNALLEASLCGLPLIASNVGGVPEIVENSVNGFLVPPEKSQPLTQAIAELASNAELRKKMSIEGRRLIKEKFSEESIVNKIDEIYKSVLTRL